MSARIRPRKAHAPTRHSHPLQAHLVEAQTKQPFLKFNPYFTLMSLCISFLIYSSRDFIKETSRPRYVPYPPLPPSVPLSPLAPPYPHFCQSMACRRAFSDRDAYFSQVSHFAQCSNSTWQLLDDGDGKLGARGGKEKGQEDGVNASTKLLLESRKTRVNWEK